MRVKIIFLSFETFIFNSLFKAFCFKLALNFRLFDHTKLSYFPYILLTNIRIVVLIFNFLDYPYNFLVSPISSLNFNDTIYALAAQVAKLLSTINFESTEKAYVSMTTVHHYCITLSFKTQHTHIYFRAMFKFLFYRFLKWIFAHLFKFFFV